LALLVFSCSGDNTNEPPEPSPTVIYKIGVLIPLTGAGAFNGEQSKATVEYAVTQINNYFSASNINVKIEAIYKDSGTDSSQSLLMLKEFFTDSIKIVVGPYSSTVLQGIKCFADSAGILLISHSSVATTLSVKDDNIFRFVPSDQWQAKAIAKLMLADNKKVVLPLVRDDVWGGDLFHEVYKVLENSQISLQSPVIYSPLQTNFSSIIQNIKSKIEDLQNTFLDKEIAVYMITYGEGTEIMRQCSYFDIFKDIKFYGGSAYAFNNTLQKNELAAATAVATHLECPIMGFNYEYSNRFTPLIEKLSLDLLREPDSYALSIYDVVYTAGLTLSSVSDTVSIDQIKETLRETLKTYIGINGKVELDDNDDRINVCYDFISLKYQDNLYKWFTSAVYDTEIDKLTRK
jgi:branched-chain amino acid transport system substrate-binding protein